MIPLSSTGVRFSFDPKRKPGNRIEVTNVQVNDQPLSLSGSYVVATKMFIQQGKDGYTSLAQGIVINGDVAELR